MSLTNDDWRQYQLFRTLAKEGNPFKRFSTGNLKTLQCGTIRKELLEFYNKFYSSNLMRLVVYGKENLEKLE